MPKQCHCGLPVFSKGLCMKHWRTEYTKPLKRTPIKKKPYKIKPRSSKRRKEENKYNYEAKRFKSERPHCEARLPTCTGFTQDVHHMATRTNRNLLEKENWLPVCRNCHIWVTEHSKEAIELGLSKSRHTN